MPTKARVAVAAAGVATAMAITFSFVGLSGGNPPHPLPGVLAVQNPNPTMTSTFIQPSINAQYPTINWNRTQWDTEFSEMKDVGITTVIVQWTVDQDANQAYYPDPSTWYPQKTDMVGNIMQAAKDEGMKGVWLGLANTSAWQQYAGNSTWLEQQAQDDETTADQLYKLYGSEITGFFVSDEVNDVLLNTPADVGPMTDFFSGLATYFHAHDGDLPVMESPTYQSHSISNTQFASDLATVMGSTDVLNVQDSGGSGYIIPSDISYWFSALKTQFAGTATEIWDDPDMYAVGGGPMPVSQLSADMQAAYGDVSSYSGFSFPTALDPAVVGQSVYNAYETYAHQYTGNGAQ